MPNLHPDKCPTCGGNDFIAFSFCWRKSGKHLVYENPSHNDYIYRCCEGHFFIWFKDENKAVEVGS